MVTIVLGAQWGDEGKGKIVDYLSANADVVARYQGGANAGHTIVTEHGKFILHLLPAGILRPDTVCVIGTGVVIDPAALMDEIAQVQAAGISLDGRLFVSHQAHLIMPYHKLLDQLAESQSGRKIGTTGRGIGPAYVDKIARVGIRIVDLLDRECLTEKIRANVKDKNQVLSKIYDVEQLDVNAIVDEYLEFDQKIDPYVKDVSVLLDEAIRAGKRIILEGAQGTLLDVDSGTYPYVTSSNPTAGGACTGLGIGPRKITRVIGIMKAYTTRVGEGPFPTELEDGQAGNINLRERGDEYGATTGRPRRCGWFDGVVARFSARINGVDSWAITKLDILTGVNPIKVCVAYEDGQRTYKHFPSDARLLRDLRPVYDELPGWTEPVNQARSWNDLPNNARKYLEYIQEFTDTPVSIISVGPGRDETIVI